MNECQPEVSNVQTELRSYSATNLALDVLTLYKLKLFDVPGTRMKEYLEKETNHTYEASSSRNVQRVHYSFPCTNQYPTNDIHLFTPTLFSNVQSTRFRLIRSVLALLQFFRNTPVSVHLTGYIRFTRIDVSTDPSSRRSCNANLSLDKEFFECSRIF